IPAGCGVRIQKRSWPVPRIFRVIQERGGVAEAEMYRTLNMGIGMTAVVKAADAGRMICWLAARGQRAWVIGELTRDSSGVVVE
ncbi:MAG TPA: AIR synthase-related protein, partial [Candidatus Aminicenantes bacterium]|nr:AIR synthase-related protein [Candidatus Aminicenantes bacterium]